MSGDVVDNTATIRESGRRSICCCCTGKKNNKDVIMSVNQNGKQSADHAESQALTPTEPAVSVSTPVEDQVRDAEAFHQDNSVKTSVAGNHTCKQRCKKCCKKFVTFLFSNLGLCSAVVAYSVLGGFIFQHLEAPYEIQKRHLMTNKRSRFAQELWNMTDSIEIFIESNYTHAVEKLLVRFQTEVLKAKSDGWDGSDGDVEPLWSFAGSLLYCVTVITTIGYGHIAPKTFEGRLATIFYALIGIPLTLLCLTNMGSFLGDCFRLLYKHTCRLLTWMCCPPQDSFTKSRQNNSIKRSRQSSSSSRSFSDQSSKRDLLPLQLKGDDIDSNTLHVVTLKAPLNDKGGRKRSRSRSTSPSPTGSDIPTDINIVVEDFDRPRVQVSQKTEEIRVPIFVSLMIIAIYIVGGALMFSVWENWDYLEGSYFCFITLSTIGFGDYVPGSISRTDSVDSRKKLIMCCVYLLFGLSVIAMCFNLMQEDVKAKFRWLGIKIGLIEDK